MENHRNIAPTTVFGASAHRASIGVATPALSLRRGHATTFDVGRGGAVKLASCGYRILQGIPIKDSVQWPWTDVLRRPLRSISLTGAGAEAIWSALRVAITERITVAASPSPTFR